MNKKHKELVFSGVQPTGNLHLGNYLGAMKNFVDLQKKMSCIYCVVDLHAITVFKNPNELRENILETTAGFLACGLDFNKSISTKSNLSLFRDGFLVAFLSPKAWVFFAAIFPQFLNLEGDFGIQLIILIISWVVLDFSTLMLYGFTATKIVSWFKTNPKVINTISACVLIIIAIIIVFSQSY